MERIFRYVYLWLVFRGIRLERILSWQVSMTSLYSVVRQLAHAAEAPSKQASQMAAMWRWSVPQQPPKTLRFGSSCWSSR